MEDKRGKAGELKFQQVIECSACQTKTELDSEGAKESLVISEKRNNKVLNVVL